ncbi:MAG: phosphatidate cytidylyltransferase, partial [Pseudomonadota bacterium]
MLIQRVITAIVALAAIALALMFLPQWGITVLVGVLFVLGGREWGRLVVGGGRSMRYLYSAAIGSGCALLWWLAQRNPALADVVYTAALVGWAVAFWLVLRYPVNLTRGVTVVAGLFVLLPAFLALALLFNGTDGIRRLLFMLVIVWCADAGAYFAGKLLG